MITVEQATDIILSNTISPKIESVQFQQSTGRVLMEDLVADRDFPPFNRVMMDGVALRFDDVANGQRVFPIKGVQAAGSPATSVDSAGVCIEIMTGAVLPPQFDCVIKYEEVEIIEGEAHIRATSLEEFQNIHEKGRDKKQGETILQYPKVISAAEIGVAATIGKHYLKVAKIPRTVVISTGDELVNVQDMPALHQIRKSNVFTIESLLSTLQIPVTIIHVEDDEWAINRQLLYAKENFDVVILSGGVSKGKFDYIPDALEKLGVEKLFHRVRQRPGKPFWFGKWDRGVVFALPGNPVSTTVCTMRYVMPWFRQSLGLSAFNYETRALHKDFMFEPNLQYFATAALRTNPKGQQVVAPIKGNGSGDLASLVQGDGFIELPADKRVFHQGETFRFFSYR